VTVVRVTAVRATAGSIVTVRAVASVVTVVSIAAKRYCVHLAW
jgi:hypothetical protein